MTLKSPYLYDFIAKLCRSQAEVIPNHLNPNVRGVDKNKAWIKSKRGLNLVAVRPVTIQVTNCTFRAIK
jgi:hypothetical protein